MNIDQVVTEFVSAVLIVMVWSIMYRETRFFRVAEHLTIGSIFGYTSYAATRTLIDKTFNPLAATGSIALVIVTFFGFLMWTRLIPKFQWISRLSIALMAGISMAVGVRGAIGAQIIKLTVSGSWIIPTNPMESINNIIIMVSTMSVVAYFLYTREHTGVFRPVSKVARTALMVGFGAILGTFLMGNTAFSIGQIGQLTSGTGVYVTIIAVVLILIDIARGGIKEKET
jgi:hypothetical protein